MEKIIMDKEKEKLSKEIFLICKGRYNYEKYGSVFNAMNEYYHKYYCDDIDITYKLANQIFLFPMVEWILENHRDNKLHSFLYHIFNNNSFLNRECNYDEGLFKKILNWVVVIDVKHYNEETDEYEWIIDLSDFYGKDVDLE